MEELLEKDAPYALKRLTMRGGHQCSLQYHQQKTETIYVLSGALYVTLTDTTRVLMPGDVLTIPAGAVHRMRAEEDTVYLEVSTLHLDDVVRLEDIYGRC